jgi:hypothetical protein
MLDGRVSIDEIQEAPEQERMPHSIRQVFYLIEQGLITPRQVLRLLNVPSSKAAVAK